jgi:hypothetical protein
MHYYAATDSETTYCEESNHLGDLRSDMQRVTKESDYRKNNRKDVQPIRNVNSGQIGIPKAKLKKHGRQADGRDDYYRGRTEESSAIGERDNYCERSD